jgi:hypothetical protein
VTQATDVYALSLVAYFLLSRGRHPFADGKGSAVDFKKQQSSDWSLAEAGLPLASK